MDEAALERLFRKVYGGESNPSAARGVVRKTSKPGPKPGSERVLRLTEDIAENWQPADAPDETVEPEAGWLGVDVGFIYPAVDSDGRIYRWARRNERKTKGYSPAASDVVVRKANGDSYKMPSYTADQLADVAARAETKEDELRSHIIARQIVKSATATGRGIVLEDWDDFRSHRPAWIRIYQHVIKQAKEQRVPLRTVNRAYSSQICPECGHLSKKNRPTRGQFKCVDCGFEGQADHVAARNLQNRAPDGKGIVNAYACSNPHCEKAPWRKGMCCSCYFYRRRYGIYPTAERLERLQVARNYREFHRSLEEVGRPPVKRKEPGPTEIALSNRMKERADAIEEEREKVRRSWDDVMETNILSYGSVPPSERR